MSFLYPAILSAVAVVGYVIVLHMVRRKDLLRMEFASLLLLRPTITRATRRRRLEDIVLLILRSLVIVSLAAGFARPFIPSKTDNSQITTTSSRTLLLIDTSASMRRIGLWDQAIGYAKDILQQAQVQDRLGIMTFDASSKTILGFEQWASTDPSQRTSMALDILESCRPGWGNGHLDMALVSALQMIEQDIAQEDPQIRSSNLVLISDMEFAPTAIEGLQGLDWPSHISITVRQVLPKNQANAALLLGQDPAPSVDQARGPTIQITNSPSARIDQFTVHWSSQQHPLVVYVPAGSSASVDMPGIEPGRPDQIILSGDDEPFGNNLFFVNNTGSTKVSYIGDADPADPQEVAFYLAKALHASGMGLSIINQMPNVAYQDLQDADMIVLDSLDPDIIASVRNMVQEGKLCLVLVRSCRSARTIQALAGLDGLECSQKDLTVEQGHAMISRIDTAHMVLSEFALPRYSNFSQIHIFRYRAFDITGIPNARPMIWLDSNEPGIFELRYGRGSLVVMTFLWSSPDSDLALSSKFVPLVYGLLEYSRSLRRTPTQYYVGQPIDLKKDRPAVIITPNNDKIRLQIGESFWPQIPGIYRIIQDQQEYSLAVNVHPDESLSWSAATEAIEAIGLPIGQYQIPPAVTSRQMAQDRFQLEAKGRLWRWFILLAMIALLSEIAIAGIVQGKVERYDRRSAPQTT